jgi:type IV secretory pathway VirB10-like protein
VTDPERPNADLKPPPLAEVTRLNRNVLLVAAMGVAVIVLAVTHVVRSDARAAAREPRGASVEAGAVGSFLDDAGDRSVPIPPPAYPELEQARSSDRATGATPTAGYMVTSPMPAYASLQTLPIEVDPDEEAYQRALRADVRPGGGPRQQAWPSLDGFDGASASGPFADAGQPLTSQLEDIGSAAFMAATSSALGNPGREPSDDGRRGLADPLTYGGASLEDPVSEYQVMAGTVLPAMMVTAMNSEVPGEIVAQISRNVFDSQQRHLLIPRGTRVLGGYDSQIALGQSRALIAWTRLIFPDGRSLSLPGLPTKDLRGAAGVRSQVDNHYGRLYGQAVLLSLIGAGAQLSQPQQSNVLIPSAAGQVAAGALGQELSRISMETIRRNMDVRPTLEIKPGTPFHIFLERDLVFDGPYVDRRAGLLAGGNVVR